MLGSVCLSAGETAFAETWFDKALSVDSTATDALSGLAQVYTCAGGWADEREPFENLLTQECEPSIAHNELGLLLRRQGRNRKAETHFRLALTLHENYAVAHNNLDATLIDLDRIEEAVNCYRQAIRHRRGFSEAHFNLANAHVFLSAFEDAVIEYRKAIEINPDFKKAHNALGGIYRSLGSFDQAIECYKTAIELDGEYAEAYAHLVLADSREIGEEFLGRMESLVQSEQVSAGQRANLWYGLGSVYDGSVGNPPGK